MLGEIFVGLPSAGFEQRDFQAGFREALAGPAAGRAGTDDEDIVVFLFGHESQFEVGC